MSAWSADKISDVAYRAKFLKLPGIIEDWLGALSPKSILDFGCGEATTALAIALAHPRSQVFGIDILPNVERCAPFAAAQLGLDRLPDNLHLQQVKPGSLLEPAQRLDLIYSWSVFEHVDQELLKKTFALLRGTLNPGGRLLIQIAPLYYSQDGSHLMAWVPEPWGHLTNQQGAYLQKLHDARDGPDQFYELRSLYEMLNKLTGDQLVDYAAEGGFRVVKQYRTDRDGAIPKHLLGIYRREVLLNEQIVLLLEPR